MRAWPGRLDLTCREGDEVAAVADAHRVVAQDLERLAARSDRGTLMDRAGAPVSPGIREPVTDVISGAIRDNARESGSRRGPLFPRVPQVTTMPARTGGGLSEVMGHYL